MLQGSWEPVGCHRPWHLGWVHWSLGLLCSWVGFWCNLLRCADILWCYHCCLHWHWVITMGCPWSCLLCTFYYGIGQRHLCRLLQVIWKSLGSYLLVLPTSVGLHHTTSGDRSSPLPCLHPLVAQLDSPSSSLGRPP